MLDRNDWKYDIVCTCTRLHHTKQTIAAVLLLLNHHLRMSGLELFDYNAAVANNGPNNINNYESHVAKSLLT